MNRIFFLSLFFLLVGCDSIIANLPQSDSFYWGDLEGRLSVDRREGHAGQPIHIVFTVTNINRNGTGKPTIIQTQATPVMDILVHYAGRELVRWSTQNSAAENLHHLELKSGESRTIEMIWIPNEQVYGLMVDVQGLLSWSDDRTADTTLFLPVDYVLVR